MQIGRSATCFRKARRILQLEAYTKTFPKANDISGGKNKSIISLHNGPPKYKFFVEIVLKIGKILFVSLAAEFISSLFRVKNHEIHLDKRILGACLVKRTSFSTSTKIRIQFYLKQELE